MLKIYDNKVYRDGKEIGWIDGSHIKDMSGARLGYYEGEFVYNQDARKVAYIEQNELKFENGTAPVSLQHVNDHIEGTYPPILKCAVQVLLEE